MAEPLQDVDDFFGKPDVDSFFGNTSEQSNPKPMSGQFMDYLWSLPNSQGGKILSAIGQGASQNWGATVEAFHPDDVKSLKDAQLWDSHQTLNTNISKAYNELLRPQVAQGLSKIMMDPGTLAVAGAAGIVGGIGGGLSQLADTMRKRASRFNQGLEGEAGEGLGALAMGQYFGDIPSIPKIGELENTPRPTILEDVTKARAEGKLGEGEEGFFNTVPVSKENLKARDEASNDAGLPQAPLVKPPVTDVNQLARQVDPDLFDKHDNLVDLYNKRKATIEDLYNKEIDTPEYLEAQKRVDKALEAISGSKITQANRGQLANQAFDLLDTDHPKLGQLNEALADFDKHRDNAIQNVGTTIENLRAEMIDLQQQIRDLGPSMFAAKTRAEELLPDIKSQAQSDWYSAASKYSEDVLKHDNPEQFPEDSKTEGGPTSTAKPPPESPQSPPLNAEDTKLKTEALKQQTETSKTKIRGLSKSVDARAIANGLKESLGDLPEYESTSWKEQGDLLAHWSKKDYQRIEDAALGTKKPPTGMLATAAFRFVEDVAHKEGNWELLHKLATQSKIPEQITTAAQNLGYLGNKSNQLSVVNAIQSIVKARQKLYDTFSGAKKAVDSSVESMKKAVKSATNITKEDWTKFFDGIQCDDE